MSGRDVDGQLPLSKLFVATLSTANDPKRVEHLLLDTFSQSKNWSWGLSGRSWTLWASLGVVLGGSWAVLGRSWELLGTSWGAPGPSWVVLGSSWGGLGRLLGRPGALRNRPKIDPKIDPEIEPDLKRPKSLRSYACSGFRARQALNFLNPITQKSYQTL